MSFLSLQTVTYSRMSSTLPLTGTLAARRSILLQPRITMRQAFPVETFCVRVPVKAQANEPGNVGERSSEERGSGGRKDQFNELLESTELYHEGRMRVACKNSDKSSHSSYIISLDAVAKVMG